MSTFIKVSVVVCFFGLVIGIPCWAVGASRPDFYNSAILTSIPLFPANDDVFGPYNFAESVENVSEKFVKVELTYSNIVSPKERQTVYFLHNLWGYSINVSIEGNNSIAFQNNFQRNMDYDKPDQVDINSDIVTKILPDSMTYTEGNVLVKCPKSTLFTKNIGMEPSCMSSVYGEFTKIPFDLQTLEIGSVVFHDLIPPIYIVLRNSSGLPMNFVHDPVVLMASWEKSNSQSLIIAGVVFFSVSLLFLLILFIIWLILDVC